MPYPNIVRRALGLALASGSIAILAILGSAPVADAAAGFGELTRFGKTGTGPGELAGFEPAEAEALDIGVDPADNSVYVIDEPKEDEEVGKEFIRHIRLQKFKSVGGKYEVVASVEVTEQSPEGSTFTVEGVAVDSKRKRVYLLATDVRAKSAKIDIGKAAASTLYAFSTEESGSTLVPEGKTGAVLIGPKSGELEAQSSTHGKALLEPGGITVDPKSGDVIILAQEDAEVGGTPTPRYVLQRVSSTGTLGARYVDAGGFLKKGFFSGTKPDSPIVAGPESSPRVYVNFEGLVEIPYDFTSNAAPKQVFEEPHELLAEVTPIESGVERQHGGALSVSPDGSTIYGDAEITNEHDQASYPGVYARSASTGALIGWSGGQSPRLSNEDECVLNPLLSITKALIPLGVGSGEKIFVLATGFLVEEEEESEETPPVPHPAVVELGPGGKGCPSASSESLQAKASGTALKQGEEILPGTTVTFAAHPLGADALSVTWQVENDKTHATTEETKATNVAAGEYRVPKFAFKFSGEAGEYTVTAVMHTDDLQTPLLEKTPEEKPISFALKVKETGTKTPVTTTTTLSGGGKSGAVISVVEGSAVSDAAKLSGANAASASGTVTFDVYSDSGCSKLLTAAGTVAVSGGVVPASEAKVLVPGTYYWQASYSGDASNQASKSACGSEVETVVSEKAQQEKEKIEKEKQEAEARHAREEQEAEVRTREQQAQERIQREAAEAEERAAGERAAAALKAAAEKLAAEEVARHSGGSNGVLSYQASLASTRIAVSKSGALSLIVNCAGSSSCTGTVTLRTLTAVSVGHSKHKTILSLASASFAAPGAHKQTVPMHLSTQGRRMLASAHTLKARATVLARDSAGGAHTTVATITLGLARGH